jgi:hypothetical protein
MRITEVITYRRNAYFNLKMASGERVLVSIAKTGFKIIQMKFGGIIPARTIVDWPVAEVDAAFELFEVESTPTQHLLDAIMIKLLTCTSIKDIEQFCTRR